MATGFVTTTRVVHATPSALYSHTANRRWECETKMKTISKERGCKDIARQLIEDEPGRNINVIMGGGRQCLVSNVTTSPNDPVDTWSCYSTDGRDLIHDWHIDKEQRQLRHAILQNNNDLTNLNANNNDFVLGKSVVPFTFHFHNWRLILYLFSQEFSPTDISNLITTEIPDPMGCHRSPIWPKKHWKFWRKIQKDFCWLSKADWLIRPIIVDVLVKLYRKRLPWTKRYIKRLTYWSKWMWIWWIEFRWKLFFFRFCRHRDVLDDTLVIVTADHSHTLSINGYPDRGTSIFGVAQKSKIDQIPYTTLTYGTGGPASFQMVVDDSGMVHRRDPSLENTSAFEYVQQAAILTDENTHGGSDVMLHARGPWSHLFHRVHEQSYVAHVISYAARIGRFRTHQAVQDLLGAEADVWWTFERTAAITICMSREECQKYSQTGSDDPTVLISFLCLGYCVIWIEKQSGNHPTNWNDIFIMIIV